MTLSRKKIFITSAIAANSVLILSAIVQIVGYVLRDFTGDILTQWTVIGLLGMAGYSGAVYSYARSSAGGSPEYNQP